MPSVGSEECGSSVVITDTSVSRPLNASFREATELGSSITGMPCSSDGVEDSLLDCLTHAGLREMSEAPLGLGGSRGDSLKNVPAPLGLIDGEPLEPALLAPQGTDAAALPSTPGGDGLRLWVGDDRLMQSTCTVEPRNASSGGATTGSLGACGPGAQPMEPHMMGTCPALGVAEPTGTCAVPLYVMGEGTAVMMEAPGCGAGGEPTSGAATSGLVAGARLVSAVYAGPAENCLKGPATAPLRSTMPECISSAG